MFYEPNDPFLEMKRKQFCRFKNTLQFSIYEKISFFIISKYSPLSGAKKFIKINHNKLEEIYLPEVFSNFFILLFQN